MVKNEQKTLYPAPPSRTTTFHTWTPRVETNATNHSTEPTVQSLPPNDGLMTKIGTRLQIEIDRLVDRMQEQMSKFIDKKVEEMQHTIDGYQTAFVDGLKDGSGEDECLSVTDEHDSLAHDQVPESFDGRENGRNYQQSYERVTTECHGSVCFQ